MNPVPPHRIAPDGTIGILGGGQLGRMLALAAARLGFKCHIYAPEPNAPAFDVVRRVTVADYTDEAALAAFAEDCDVVTYEFENVPSFAAAFLATRLPVLPDVSALTITQDRLFEKSFVTDLGLPTAAFAGVESAADLAEALIDIGRPAVLKTRRFGYDGKGQAMLRADTAPAEAFRLVGEQPSIVEAFVPFVREVSVVLARGRCGTVRAYEPVENVHRDHILHRSTVPAAITPDTAREAVAIATRIAEAFDYVGVLAVELFVVGEAGDERLLVNEIAPRVHNSGHWTLDGASVSQFEQHIRAVAGLPLAVPVRFGPVTMTNLIGEEVHEIERHLVAPGTTVHLYGKASVRAGRKMGHITRVG